MILLWLNKVGQAFADKLKSISDKLSIIPDWLMFIMNFETGGTFSPSIQNPNGNATGLIQFLPSTAIGLGTTVEALKQMTAVEQMDWVYKYLKQQQDIYGRFSSYHDLYLAIFYPRAIAEKDNYILGIEKGTARAQAIAKDNPAFDINNDLQITKAEFKQWLDGKVKQIVPQSYWDLFFKKKVFSLFINEKLSLAA